MRRAFFALVLLSVSTLRAQTPAPPQPLPQDDQSYTLRTESNVVLMPTQVQVKNGDILYGLKPEQFVVEDNGVPQKVHLDEDTDALGLSLVVAIQCSRTAVMEYAKVQGLATMIDDIAGDAPREVAIVSYGAEPQLLGKFASDPDHLRIALNNLEPCDDGEAATLDAVEYATKLLEQRNNHYRHAVLLISETRDHGSKAKAAKVVAELGRTNTVVDSVAFSPARNEIVNDLKYGGGSGPIGLLVMAVNAMKKNAAKELASLSGGEYQGFTSQKNFDKSMHQLSNHIHNYYLLSFQPHSDPNAPAGLHSLMVKIPDYPDAKIRTRESYWSGALDVPPEAVQ